MSWNTARPTSRRAHGPASPAPTTDSSSAQTSTTPRCRRLAQGDLADLVWEAPDDFTAEHASSASPRSEPTKPVSSKKASDSGSKRRPCGPAPGQPTTRPSELLQAAGLTRFSPVKPQRWVIASFEHHCGPHGLPHPHIHNIVMTGLTTKSKAAELTLYGRR